MCLNNKCVQSKEFWVHAWGLDKNVTMEQIPECNICREVCLGIEAFRQRKSDNPASKACDVNSETFAAHTCIRDLEGGWDCQWLGCVTCKVSHHVDNYCKCGTCFMQSKDLYQEPTYGYVHVTCSGCGKRRIWY